MLSKSQKEHMAEENIGFLCTFYFNLVITLTEKIPTRSDILIVKCTFDKDYIFTTVTDYTSKTAEFHYYYV